MKFIRKLKMGLILILAENLVLFLFREPFMGSLKVIVIGEDLAKAGAITRM